MIQVPNFTPGQSLRTTPTGWRVTNPQTDPPVPPENGGYNFNAWEPWLGVSGNFESALNFAAVLNAAFPLSVSASGVLIY